MHLKALFLPLVVYLASACSNTQDRLPAAHGSKLAADEICVSALMFNYHVTIDDLDNFAKGGKPKAIMDALSLGCAAGVTEELARELVNTKIVCSVELRDAALASPAGQSLIKSATKVVKPGKGVPQDALPGIMTDTIKSVCNADGDEITVVKVMKAYPADTIRVDAMQLLKEVKPMLTALESVSAQMGMPLKF